MTRNKELHMHTPAKHFRVAKMKTVILGKKERKKPATCQKTTSFPIIKLAKEAIFPREVYMQIPHQSSVRVKYMP